MIQTVYKLFFVSFIVQDIVNTNGHVLPSTKSNMTDSELDTLINLAFGLNSSNSGQDASKTNSSNEQTSDNYAVLKPDSISSVTVKSSTHTPEKRDADLESTSSSDLSQEEDVDPLNVGCICVPQEDCDLKTGTLSTNLEGIIDERTRTCDRPSDVLCCVNGTSNQSEDQFPSYENKSGSSYQTSDRTTYNVSGSNSNELSNKLTNTEGSVGSSFESSEDFTCKCHQGVKSSNFHQTSHHGSHSDSLGQKGDAGTDHTPSEEMHCVCRRLKSQSRPHHKTSYGHHHIYSPNQKGNLESSYQQSEELHCVCEQGQTQSATHWSYGQTQQTGENSGTSLITGQHSHTTGTENTGGGSYSSSNSQSHSTSTSYGQNGYNSNGGSTVIGNQHSGTVGNYGQEYNSGNDGTTSLTGSTSHSQSHSSGNTNYGQQGDTNSNTGVSYQSTENANFGTLGYGTTNKGNTSTSNVYSHSQSSAESTFGQSEHTHGTDDNISNSYQTTELINHDKHTSGTYIDSSSSASSNAHSSSLAESHSSGGTIHAHGDHSHSKEGETTPAYHTTSSSGYGNHEYSTGTDSNGGGLSHSYSNSQSQSQSSVNTNSHNKQQNANSDVHETGYNQHTTAIKGSTDTTHSYAQSEAESHSSAKVTYHTDSHGQEESITTSYQESDDNKYIYSHTTQSSINTGLNNSYSHSQSETQSHSSSGEIDYNNNSQSQGHQDIVGSSHEQTTKKDHIHGEHITGSNGSTGTTSSNSYSEAHAYAESHSQSSAQTSDGHSGQEDNSDSLHHHHQEHTSGATGTTASTHSSGETNDSGKDTILHGHQSSTNSLNQGNIDKEHGQHEHTSGSGDGTSGSYSHSQSNSQSQSHSSGGTSSGQGSQYQVEKNTSNHLSDNKKHGQYGEHSSGAAVNTGSSHSQTESHSQSSAETSYGQDGNSDSLDSSQKHTEEKHHGQHEHSTGTENSGIDHTHLSSGTNYGNNHSGEGSNTISQSQSHASSGSSSGSYDTGHGSSGYNDHYGYNNKSGSNYSPSEGQSNYDGCGYSKFTDVAQRIKSDSPDSESLFGQFPWMVAILTKTKGPADEHKNTFVFVCGGSLIHPQVVLSATHCIVKKDIKSLVVRAGEWNAQANDEILPHQQEDVDKIVRHPDFYSGALYNDVSLIFIKKPFRFADNIDIVCLPPPSYAIDYSEKCLVSGWGKDSIEKTSKYQPILRQVELPLVPRHECQEKLQKTRLGEKFKLHDTFICAGGQVNEDTCKGDGGGPLVCPIKGSIERYHQVGIVSWGIGCGSDTPAVYVNVKSFIGWIDEQMQKANLKPQYHY